MDIRFEELGIYNIDVPYLKYLHDQIDSEVYYAPEKYDTKPFLGLVVGIGEYTYFIPFSSSKPRHLKWKNVALDHYLIYEIVDKNSLSAMAVCKPYDGDNVQHILAALDMKKMIPVPSGLYSKVEFNQISDAVYKTLLEKEYRFCVDIQDGIIERVTKIYKDQKLSGKVHKYYCNFAALEKACKEYKKP